MDFTCGARSAVSTSRVRTCKNLADMTVQTSCKYAHLSCDAFCSLHAAEVPARKRVRTHTHTHTHTHTQKVEALHDSQA